MPTSTPFPKIKLSELQTLVLGDVSLDTLIVPLSKGGRPSEDGGTSWESEGTCWWHRRRGGAWLLCDIINDALAFDNPAEKKADTYNTTLDKVTDEEINTFVGQDHPSSSAVLGLFPRTPQSKREGKDQVYRVERFLGWMENAWRRNVTGPANHEEELRVCLKNLPQMAPHILVLHDRNGHFRRFPEYGQADSFNELLGRHLEGNKHFLPRAGSADEQDKGPGWIVWQMFSPLAQGGLWDALSAREDWRNRTIAVVKVECLRQAGANIAEGISLEHESEKFLKSIEQIECLAKLATVRHLVVHFHRQGVLHYDRERGLQTSCYFCPFVNDDPDQRKYGTMVGYTSILVAAIVRGIAWSLHNGRNVSEGLIDGIKQGVVLDKRHYQNGYAGMGFHEQKASTNGTGGKPSALVSGGPASIPNPYQKLFKELGEAHKNNLWYTDDEWKRYRLAALALPGGPEILNRWSRIEGFVGSRRSSARARKSIVPALDVALKVVRFGLKKVVDPEPIDKDPKPADERTPGTPPDPIQCPYEIHGKIKTADRHEIESFASIRRVMEKYLDSPEWKHPLSIAVFGPPGSGKNFTIKQILENVNPEIAKRPLEYNVAQFREVGDLETAFHQAQDRALANEVPLVIFDEFDTSFGTERLGWLKYFLAPMQDGKFKAGEGMYRIGRAIFVFAGGIAKTFSEFYDKQKEQVYFKDAKGPDFVSRLRAHLNIASVNCPKEAEPAAGENDSKSSVGPVLMFRRAVLFRSLLEEHLKDIFDKNTEEARIDPGVVQAFLQVKQYEHETRSMQAIIEMTRISPRGRFQKSSLPAYSQLNMHVNAAEFLDLVNRAEFAGPEDPREAVSQRRASASTSSRRLSETAGPARSPRPAESDVQPASAQSRSTSTLSNVIGPPAGAETSEPTSPPAPPADETAQPDQPARSKQGKTRPEQS